MLAVHGGSKGRDTFAFDPISSSYLEGTDIRVFARLVRRPFSRSCGQSVASWDDELRAWRVPFRSFEELRRRWPSIEKAAEDAEPGERKRRRDAARDTEAYKASQMRNAECRRHRYLQPVEDLPPLGRPFATAQYGIAREAKTARLREARIAQGVANQQPAAKREAKPKALRHPEKEASHRCLTHAIPQPRNVAN